MMNGVHVL
jgi:hypothetical protein